MENNWREELVRKYPYEIESRFPENFGKERILVPRKITKDIILFIENLVFGYESEILRLQSEKRKGINTDITNDAEQIGKINKSVKQLGTLARKEISARDARIAELERKISRHNEATLFCHKRLKELEAELQCSGTDSAYYKSILDGSWPNSETILLDSEGVKNILQKRKPVLMWDENDFYFNSIRFGKVFQWGASTWRASAICDDGIMVAINDSRTKKEARATVESAAHEWLKKAGLE